MANTNDFLSKLFAQSSSQPPVPLMDPNAEDEPKQEDFAPAEMAEPMSLANIPTPDLDKRKQILDQYKSFRVPASEEKPKDESELESHLNNMDANNASRLDQELASADFDQQAMASPFPEEATMESQSPRSKVLSDYQRLKNAQTNYSDQLANLAMLGGGNKIAEGFAYGKGAKIGDNAEGIKQLQMAAQQPVSNVMEQIKVGGDDMNDPASDISKFTRAQAYALLKKLDPNTDYNGKLEDMSAQQLSKLPGMNSLMKNAGQVRADWIATDRVLANGHPVKFNKQTGTYHDGITGDAVAEDQTAVRDIARRDALTGNYGYVSRNGGMQVMPTNYNSTQVKSNPGEQGKQQEVKFSDFAKTAPEQAKEFRKMQDKFNADMKESRDVATSMTTLATKLGNGDTKDVDSGMLGSIQTQAARMAGQRGVLTDQDLVKFGGAGGWDAAAQRAVSNAANGKITQKDLEFFRTFKDKMGKSLNSDISNRSQLFTEQGRQMVEAIVPNVQDSDIQKWLAVDKVAPIAQNKQVDKKVDEYAKAHNLTYDQAMGILTKRGYKSDVK